MAAPDERSVHLVRLDRNGQRTETGHIRLQIGNKTVLKRTSLNGEDNVSRRCAAVVDCTGDKTKLRDFGSANGTYVNGVRIPVDTDVEVRSGDVLSFGGPVKYRENNLVKYNRMLFALFETRKATDPPRQPKRKRACEDDGRVRDALTCSVCLDVFAAPRVLNCSHAFCLTCIDKCVRAGRKSGRASCPTCRAELVGRFVGRCLPLESSVACYVKAELSEEERAAHSAREEEGEQLLDNLSKPVDTYNRVLAAITR